MPKSVSRKTKALFRKQSGNNLFEAKQETKAEVVVPEPRDRLRSNSSTDVAKQPVRRDSLSQGKAMSHSSPMLNEIKPPNDTKDVQKEAAQRTVSHNVNGRPGTLEYSATLPKQPKLQRGPSLPEGNTTAPALPPKKRASTPGVNRSAILPEVLVNATPPPRGPNQSSNMMFPPSPDIVRHNQSKFFSSPSASPRVNRASLQGTVTEVSDTPCLLQID